MKTKIAVALATLLSVVSATAQQRYLLPIGSNVNNRAAKVAVVVGPVDAWEKRVEDVFSYQPSMGEFERVVGSRLQTLVNNVPTVGLETSPYELTITTDTGPFVVKTFSLEQNGTIPHEVLDVKLQYGTAIAWWLSGVTAISMQITDSAGTTVFSTKDGTGYDAPCFLGASRNAFQRGVAAVQVEYALPEFQRERGITAGSVTLWQNERYVSFNLLDGHFIESSAEMPDFMESLRASEMPLQSQAPVLMLSVPRIAKIARVGNTTEIVVSAEGNSVATLEFAESIGGIWNAVPAYPVPLSLKAGSTQFTHTIETPSCFYRLRVVSERQ